MAVSFVLVREGGDVSLRPWEEYRRKIQPVKGHGGCSLLRNLIQDFCYDTGLHHMTSVSVSNLGKIISLVGSHVPS